MCYQASPQEILWTVAPQELILVITAFANGNINTVAFNSPRSGIETEPGILITFDAPPTSGAEVFIQLFIRQPVGDFFFRKKKSPTG